MFRGFFNRMYNGNPNKTDLLESDLPQNRFQLFFSVLGSRFMDLVKINLLFFVLILPAVLWTLWTLAALIMMEVSGTMSQYVTDVFNVLQTYLLGMIPCLMLAGPPLAGLTYVIRNWARDEHAWLWQDFKAAIKTNWKQSMIFMLIFGAVSLATFFSIRIYGAMAADYPPLTIIQILLAVIAIFIGLAYLYIFPMMVTYQLSVVQILKNSFLLALGRLPLSVMFGLLTLFPALLGILIFLLTASGIPLIVLGFYYLLMGFSLAVYVLSAYTNATFDKYLPAKQESEAAQEQEDTKDDADAE